MLESDQIQLASLTDVGRVRKENQDAFGSFTRADGTRLAIVADGMGGHRGGAVASRLCIEAVGRVFEAGQGTLDECLRLGLEAANTEVRDAAQRDEGLRGMGTTAVALAIGRAGEALIAWVGDSRAYLLRDDRISALTEDHSLVAMWVNEGVLTPEQADVHPRRNELVRAIGVMDEIEVDMLPVELREGDRLLLCSDGLCGVVPDTRIREVLGRDPPELAAAELVASANEAGGPDNITVQVIAIRSRPPAVWPARWAVAAVALLVLGGLTLWWMSS